MSELLEHERVSYDHQTIARGILRPSDLTQAFDALSLSYAHYFGAHLKGVDGRALDLPCGYGNFLYFLRKQGVAASGVDLDPAQVGLAASLGLDAKVGDCSRELSSAKGLGLVSSLDFLEHIDKDDAVRFLQQSRAALAPGGLLILRVPSADGPFGAHDFGNDLTHRWVATATAMRSLLGACGFEVISIHDEYPPPVSLKRLGRYLLYRVATKLVGLVVYCLGMTPPLIWTRSMWIVACRP